MRFATRILCGLAITSTCFAQSIITTVAGTEFVFPAGSRAALDAPIGRNQASALDQDGNLYIAATDSNVVLKILPDGTLSVFAGNGLRPFSRKQGEGGLAVNASITPYGVAADSKGNIYIGAGSEIRKVGPDGVITTISGSFKPADGMLASDAILTGASLAIDSRDRLYVCLPGQSQVFRIEMDGTLKLIAGTGTAGYSGDGGPATAAQLNYPSAVAADPDGNVYIADQENLRIRKVSVDGLITTVAGNGMTSASSGIVFPDGVAVGPDGAVYFSDFYRVQKISGGTLITIAGEYDKTGFGGDGGPASQALLAFPRGLTVSSDGSVYINDEENFRVRKIAPDGMIQTFAGNGQFQFTPDGTPALSAYLNQPSALAVGQDASLYIADTNNNLLQRVNPNGLVTTVAGNGQAGGLVADHGDALSIVLSHPVGVTIDLAGNPVVVGGFAKIYRLNPDRTLTTVVGKGGPTGYGGDNGPATQALISTAAPYVGVLYDPAGNLYFSDYGNNRVRQVSPQGIITTVAGDGNRASAGDGGAATSASLLSPSGLAMDAAGNLYIGETGRIRRVGTDGMISTFAGTGQTGYSGDGGMAIQARLTFPTGLVFDAGGNLYFSDTAFQVVRAIAPSGIISTVAGNGRAGFTGDAGPSTAASLNLPYGLALDAGGNLIIADSSNDRIRSVLAAPPTFSTSADSLSFSAISQGAVTGSQTFRVDGTVPNLATQISASSTGDWLKVQAAASQLPAVVSVSADPSGLAPGSYQGTIQIAVLGALPLMKTVSVTLQVAGPVKPRLATASYQLSFTLDALSAPVSQQVTVSNSGSGSLNFTAAADGGDWITVTPQSGQATPSAPGTVRVTVNPATLAAGTYQASIRVSSDASPTLTVPVIVTVTKGAGKLFLSQAGLTFTAVEGVGVAPDQVFQVLNTGLGRVRWTSAAATVSQESGWLSAGTGTGANDAGSAAIDVPVHVNASGLSAGVYYGKVSITSADAINSPQIVTVVLNVLSAGQNPGPVADPAGLVFVTSLGGPDPGSRDITISNLTASALNFGSGAVTLDGGNWLVKSPPTGTVAAAGQQRVVVQPNTTGLSAGVYRGAVTLVFGDGSLRTVSVLLVVAPAGSAPGGHSPEAIRPANASSTACAPTKLLPVVTSIGQNFQLPVGWPATVGVRIVDDCGQAIVTGAVSATFTSGDPPLQLSSLGDGRWVGTWQPRQSASNQITIAIAAEQPNPLIRGTVQVSGGFQGSGTPPQVNPAGIINAASLSPPDSLAPGMLIQILGTNLSDGEGRSSYPLGNEVAGTQVFLAGKSVPLIGATPTRLDVIVPFAIPSNAQQQLVIQRGRTLSVPGTVTVAPALPAIFTADGSGGGQGVIRNTRGDIVDSAHAATSGDLVTIYCTGLGPVDPPISPDQAALADPVSTVVSDVAVTIGGRSANVKFAGLTPGFSGIYQVNAEVPAGVSGDSVMVMVSSAGQTSQAVTLAVH
jgi:uncharacterized protein (TIGR03437 family)